jgi:hypothetical protein
LAPATAPPAPPESPRVLFTRSLLRVVQLATLAFGTALAVGGVLFAAYIALAGQWCNGNVGAGWGLGDNCSMPTGRLLILPGTLVVLGIVDVVIYAGLADVRDRVEDGEFLAARPATLMWGILGLFFGGIVPGLLLFVAYGELGVAARDEPGRGAGPRRCPACGRPAIYVAPAGRYYCEADRWFL